jgi:hypothetical protein
MDSSVPDPWCFDKDSDPQIRTAGLRIRILLFSPATFKMPTKNNFFFSLVFCLLITEGAFTSAFKDNKLFKSHKRVDIKVFSYFFAY